MNEMQNKMILEAKQSFKAIYPCGQKKELSECFTQMGDQLLFWFNTDDQSTHIISMPLNT